MDASPMRILIIAPSWVGDMVMAQSALIQLKHAYPQSTIDVLAPAWNQALLDRMPQVNDSIIMPIDHGQLKLLERYRIGRSLKAKKYDWAIVFPNSFKSALIPFFAGIPRRTGWIGESRWLILNDIRQLDKTEYPRMVQRFVALVYDKFEKWDKSQCPEPLLHYDVESRKQTRKKLGLTILEDQKILALCPGAAYGDAKRWPLAYYAQLANDKLDEGWQIWLLGAGADMSSLHTIQKMSHERCLVLGDNVSLAEKIDLLSMVTVIVSNDSGLLHVSAALTKPVVALYGSTTPEFTPPLTQKSVVLGKQLDCRPCFKRNCPLTQANYLKCLKDITHHEVANAIDTLMEENYSCVF